MQIIKRTLSAVVIYLFIFIPFIGLIYNSNSMEAWNSVLFSGNNLPIMLATIFVAMLSLLINLLICIPAANTLSRGNIKYNIFFQYMFFLPIIIPAFVSTMGIHIVFIKYGLEDTILGVAIIHSLQSIPYALRALMVAFGTLGKNYENMAKTLGASSIQTFFYVTFPNLIPAIITASSVTIIISFSQYITTLIIGGGKIKTLAIAMYPFINGVYIKISSVYSIVFLALNILLIIFVEIILKKIYKVR